MGEAILGAPYSDHSNEFRTKLTSDVQFIVFCDGSLAVKRGGKWSVESTGPMGEADSFVNEQTAGESK